MTESRFVGVGIGHYDGPWNDLAHPVPEVQAFADLLGNRFSQTILTDPREDEARRACRQLRESMLDGGSLVVRRLDPSPDRSWIDVLAEMGQHHPAVLRLIPALNIPLPEPPTADTNPEAGPAAEESP